MSAYQIRVTDSTELAHALRQIGADIRSLPFFENRRDIKALYLNRIDARSANVIKQELLSRGGDAAVHAKVVDCGVKASDCILFGTKKQLLFLADKLSSMPWWDFPKIVSEIRSALEGMEKRFAPAPLPDGRSLPLGSRTLIMGIVNLTDDSFFPGSRTGGDIDAALARAEALVNEGADVLDLGAESTRPGSARVPEEEELKRISSAVREIRAVFPKIPISIDTTRLSVAKAALAAGADIINDISGLTYEPEMARAAAEYGAMFVLMHMRGTPETMLSLCEYDNLLLEITQFFEKGVEQAAGMGLDSSRIILDPGIGFAKNAAQNLFILRHLEAFRTMGMPLLIGVSRKGFIGSATDSPDVKDRLAGTASVSALCTWQGVEIVRVHDVLQNKRAVMMMEAVRNAAWS